MQITNYGSAWAQQFTSQPISAPKAIKTPKTPVITVKRKRFNPPDTEQTIQTN